MDIWHNCIIQLSKINQRVACRWRFKEARLALEPKGASSFSTLDLVFTTTRENGPTKEACIESLEEPSRGKLSGFHTQPETPMSFILSHLQPGIEQPDFGELAIKLIIPSVRGYVAHSNILHQRMASCEHIQSIREFFTPFQEIIPASIPPGNSEIFQLMIRSASGGIVLQQSKNLSQIEVLQLFDSQLSIRMSIPWILPSIPSRQVVVAIGHHRLQSMETFYAAAQSLGMKLLLVDSTDDETHSHCRDGIITVDMTFDNGLESRIVEALKNQPENISGVVAYRDHLLVTAAKVGEKLGLSTLPSSAVGACVDKHAMRLRNMTNCSQFIYARSPHDLQDQIKSLQKPLEFPLVVKPSQGQGSVGVSKVANMQELSDAVMAIERYNSKCGSKCGIIVETYIDGPEIDVNFVLLYGEVLFSEVVDNFPCTADEKGNRKTDSFLERDMVYPSGLCETETRMATNTIHRLLVDNLGFRTGVFHVEARVCGSNMQYVEEGGITELHQRQYPQSISPSVFMLEVNARCPGVAGVFPTMCTHGVDLAALWLLSATGDYCRLRALARSFTAGVKVWCDLVPITVTRGGTLDSDDIMKELGERRPDLMDHVYSTTCFYKRGDVIPEPSVTNLAGIIVEFVCFSRTGRKELLGIVDQIRREVRICWK